MTRVSDIKRVMEKGPGSGVPRNRLLLFFAIMLAGVLFYWHLPGVNEFDTVIAAREFIDRDWIPADWYLNTLVQYRLPFNILAGTMVQIFGFMPAIIIGRLLCLFIFALAVSKLADLINIRWFAFFPLIAYFVKNQSLFADEWMIAGFETKSFAYTFIIFALAFAMEDRLITAAIFAGLATSAHVLVGIYGTFCIVVAYLVLRKNEIPKPRAVKLFVSVILYLVTAGFGIYAALSNIARVNPDLSRKAGEIYVQHRVAHHVLPSAWGNSLWPLISLAFLVIIIGLFLFIKRKKLRLLLFTALVSFGLLAIGAIIFYAGAVPLLKYYWFRFPDVFIPFTLIMIIAYFGTCLIEKPGKTGKVSRIAFVGLAILTLVYGGWRFYVKTASVIRHKDTEYARIEPELYEVLHWISENTDRDALFLVSPTIEEFYHIAERPMFVSLKHSPQSDAEIMEWFNRLMFITDGQKPTEGGIYSNPDWVEKQFYTLSKDELTRIRREYPIAYYLDYNDNKPLLPAVFSNNSYRLCRLD